MDFNSANSGNYSLLSASPYTGMATDGTNLGADVNAVDQATAGVE